MYIDANILIDAARDRTNRGDRARALLDRIAKGETEAATSGLTMDEFVWVLMRQVPREDAIKQGERLLRLPNLRWLPVNVVDIARALKLMEASPLNPRDAIHAAVMLGQGIQAIASNDAAFDGIPGIQRVSLAEDQARR